MIALRRLSSLEPALPRLLCRGGELSSSSVPSSLSLKDRLELVLSIAENKRGLRDDPSRSGRDAKLV